MSIEELKQLPVVAEAIAAVEAMSNMIASYSITNDASYREAADDLKLIKSAAKKLEAARDGEVRPLNERVREINAFFGGPSTQLQEAERVIKRAIAAYADEQDRIRREAQRKLDVAAAKERERLEALEAKALAAGRLDKAEQLAERAAAVVAPVAAQEAPRISGISTRESWQHEVENAALVPREYCVPDDKKIGAIVRAMHGDVVIPGVRIYCRRIVTAQAAWTEAQ